MAAIDISSTAAPLNDGVLQLQNGVAMDSTLRNVADQNDTTSPLKLSTTAVQVVSPLRITTDDPSDMYLDCEDGATNNRFNITRNTASQQVNLNFASNPGGSTTIVGAIRTYVDGVNLSEVMAFREDGYIGAGTTSPTAKMQIVGENSSSSSYAVKVLNSVGQGILSVTNDGYTQIGDFSAQGYGSFLAFLRPSGGTRVTTFNQGNSNLTITNTNGNVTYQNTPVTIVGSGSTSATTSLLVQNSSGTAALTVDDSRNVIVNGQFDVTGTSNFRVITTAANVSLRFGASPAISYNASEMYFAGSQFYFQLGTDFRFAGRGIFGSQTFNATAQLQVDSTTKGFLPPRMTTVQKNAITTPAAGLMVYDTTLNKLCVYTTAWETITSI